VRRPLLFPATILACALAPATLIAQTSDPDARAPRVEITPYVGAAFNSTTGPFLGIIPDRNHLFLGAHVNVTLVRTPRWTFAYAPEVVPVLIVSNNPRLVELSDEFGAFPAPGDPGPVWGFGFSPIGAELQRAVSDRTRLFGAAAVGAVWFTRPTPTIFARKFNYTFEYGGGIQWRHSPRTAWRVGYKFHHLSNNYTAYDNPGLDGHVFFAGVSLNPSPAKEPVP
jgi:hypothetical protein